MRVKHLLQKRNNITILMIITLASAITTIYLIQIEWQQNTERIKVMTWNIHTGVGIDDKYDIGRITEEIKSNKADIVGLQEVNEKIARRIAKRLDMEYFYHDELDGEDGNAILSKYHIEDVEIIYLSPKDDRSIIKAEIIINTEKWNIFVTHLSLRNREDNLIQTEYILNKVIKANLKRVILVGDFNFGPDSEQYNKITTNEPLKLMDTYKHLNEDRGLTFRTNYLFRRIDFIFCSTDLEPQTSEVIYSFASDHCAVMTTF
ncbi:MAG: endonuclease/exonuclease/phosphatase family protein [Promethearchaeota archaeon]